MLVVNIYGEPSAGKSTMAADVFASLKMMHVNCELVTEFAKDLVWDGNTKGMQNQAYLFGNQYYRLTRIEDSVDVAVVDSPLLLNIIYNHDKRLQWHFNEMVAYVDAQFDTLNVLLKCKNSSYESVGRVHSQDESIQIAKDIEFLLKTMNRDYIITNRENGCTRIVKEAMKRLNRYE